MEIRDTTALVTGGASGLGEATVRRLHAAGATTVIVDLAAERGEALAAELGGRAVFVKANVAEAGEVQGAVDAAVARGAGPRRGMDPLRSGVAAVSVTHAGDPWQHQSAEHLAHRGAGYTRPECG